MNNDFSAPDRLLRNFIFSSELYKTQLRATDSRTVRSDFNPAFVDYDKI